MTEKQRFFTKYPIFDFGTFPVRQKEFSEKLFDSIEGTLLG